MTTLTETAHAGEFIVSEAAGQRSRGTGTVEAGNNVGVGQLMKDNAGKLTPVTAAADTPVAIMFAAVDATAADVTGQTTFERDGEVLGSSIVYFAGATAGNITTLNAALESNMNVIVR